MLAIRPFRDSDGPAITALADRLIVGVAPWRDEEAVGAAVRGWVDDSIERARSMPEQLRVAVDEDDRVVGFVSLEKQEHWTGELDAYIGELVRSARVGEARRPGRCS